FALRRRHRSSSTVASRPSPCRISGPNLLNRSRAPPRSSCGASGWFTPSLMRSVVRQLADRVDQLAPGLDLGLLVHRDDDVALVLDRGDEIHHGQAVEFEITGEAGALCDLHALLVEGLDQGADARVYVGSFHDAQKRLRVPN